MDIPENILSSLQANIARRLTPQPVKIRSDIELTCFTYPGILAIKRALQKAAELSTTAIPLDIRLIAPPLYVLMSNATDKNAAIERMEYAIQVIKDSIESEGGKVDVQMKPKAVSESDELELEALMKRVQKENQEVPSFCSLFFVELCWSFASDKLGSVLTMIDSIFFNRSRAIQTIPRAAMLRVRFVQVHEKYTSFLDRCVEKILRGRLWSPFGCFMSLALKLNSGAGRLFDILY